MTSSLTDHSLDGSKRGQRTAWRDNTGHNRLFMVRSSKTFEVIVCVIVKREPGEAGTSHFEQLGA